MLFYRKKDRQMKKIAQKKNLAWEGLLIEKEMALKRKRGNRKYCTTVRGLKILWSPGKDHFHTTLLITPKHGSEGLPPRVYSSVNVVVMWLENNVQNITYPSDFQLVRLTWTACKAIEEVLTERIIKGRMGSETKGNVGLAKLERPTLALALINDFPALTCQRCAFL